MFRFDKDLWHALSPLLDTALHLDARGREALIADLGRQRPDIADALALLLKNHDRLLRSDFLESPLTVDETPAATLSGHVIGAYTLEAPLGMGGMGTVWRARRSDGRFDRLAAVKFLNLSLTGRGEERFTREGRILGRLAHPHIAQLLDAGVTAAGQPYLVLEYIDGECIDLYCDRHTLDPNTRVRLFLQVLDALAYAQNSFVATAPRSRWPLLALVGSVAGVVGTIIQAGAARAERDFALRQLTRAEAVNDLNLFLLTDAAPSGKPFTVNDLLARAERLVERQHGGDPVTRADLLISIGRQYWSMDEDGKSRRALTQAYEQSRTLSDASLRARASCALASVLARQGELPRAKTLVQDGLGELGDGTAFMLERVFCLQQGAETAREAGEADEAVRQDEAALQLVRESPFESELLELTALGGLAESYRVAGRMREANDTYTRALARLDAFGRGDTQRAGTWLNNQGLALYSLGRPLEAEKAFRRAIDISSAGASEEAVSPMLLINHARVLRELGRLDEAADYADRGYEKAKQSDSRVVVNQSLLLRTGIYREMGDVERAAALLAEVEPRLRKDLPPEHIAFVGLTSEHAMLARASGRREEALSLLNRVVDTAEALIKAGRQGRESLPPFLLRRATVRLELNDPGRRGRGRSTCSRAP